MASEKQLKTLQKLISSTAIRNPSQTARRQLSTKMASFKAKLFKVLLLVAIATTTSLSKSTDSHCEVPIGSKQFFLYQWPLVFQSDGELHPTTVNHLNEREIRVSDGTETVLSCGPNYLKHFGKTEVMRVTCNGATGNFTIAASETVTGERERNIKEFACDLRVIEEVVNPVSGCVGNKLTASRFGYVDPTEELTYILGEACYDTVEGRTLFAHVMLGDKNSNHLQKLDKSYLTKHRHPDGRYKLELFRGLRFDEIYERIRTQLHIRQPPLLKMANFIDDPTLSNAQFQAVKKLGWNYYVAHDDIEVLETLKQDIKHLSEGLNLDVYVGSHGVSVVHGENGEKMEIYLHPSAGNSKGRFPVPELIWIVVKHQQKATAFGVYNEASNTLEEAQHSVICASDCEKISWLVETLKTGVDRKPLICCDYREFRNVVNEMPLLADVKEMLI